MKKLFVFPSYVKWIALALVFVDVILAFLIKGNFANKYPFESKELVINIANLALLLFLMSRKRIEDEMISQQRLAVLSGSLFAGIAMIFVNNIFNVMDNTLTESNSPSMLVFQLLVLANIMFGLILRKQNKEFNAE